PPLPLTLSLHDPVSTPPYTLPLHDALPILAAAGIAKGDCAGVGEVGGKADPDVGRGNGHHLAGGDPRTRPGPGQGAAGGSGEPEDRRTTPQNSSHEETAYAVSCVTRIAAAP